MTKCKLHVLWVTLKLFIFLQVQVPKTMHMETEPVGVSEGNPFIVGPALKVLDIKVRKACVPPEIAFVLDNFCISKAAQTT